MTTAKLSDNFIPAWPPNSMLLPDKVIFLTGGSTGIGLECAKAYAAEGASVVIAALDGPASAGEAALRGPQRQGGGAQASALQPPGARFVSNPE